MADPTIPDDEAARKREERRLRQKANDAQRYLLKKTEINARRMAWSKANPDKQSEANKRSYYKHQEQRKADANERYRKREKPERKPKPVISDDEIARRKDKLRAYQREYQRKWHKENPEKSAKIRRKWRELHPERVKEIKRKTRDAHLDAIRETDRLAKRQEREKILGSGDEEAIAAYREKRRAEAREWNRKNPERAAELKALSLGRLLEKDPDHSRKLKRKSYQNNKEAYHAATMRWFKANPEKRRIYAANRKHATAGDGFTTEDIQRLYKKQKGKCPYCASSLVERYEVDHIIPISKGGAHDARNIQLLCRPCNRRKHAKHPIDFARQFGFLL